MDIRVVNNFVYFYCQSLYADDIEFFVKEGYSLQSVSISFEKGYNLECCFVKHD